MLENCEHSYSIIDCLEISEKCDPHCIWYRHFECYKLLHPQENFEEAEYYIPKILETWKKIAQAKIFMFRTRWGKIGKHSDYIDILPDYLLEIPEKYGIDIDIMIEAKAKELSIQKLYEKYPQCNCKIKE